MEAAIIASLVGTLVQTGLSLYDAQRQAQEMAAQAAEYGKISMPKLEKLVAEKMGPNALTAFKSDPALKQAQTESMGALKEVSDKGGFTSTDEAVLNRIMKDAGQQAATADSRTLSSMAARGLGGGGQEALLRQLQSQQFAEREGDQARALAGQAQERSLNAIMARGRMAGDIRGQDLGEASAVGNAQGDLDRFNIEHGYNVARGNNDLEQQQFGNRVDLLDRKFNRQTAGSQATSKGINTAGSAAGGAGLGLAQLLLRDKDKKA